MDGRHLQGGTVCEPETLTSAVEQHEVEAMLIGFIQALVNEQSRGASEVPHPAGMKEGA